MFKKKITPDFSPRKEYKQSPIVIPVPLPPPPPVQLPAYVPQTPIPYKNPPIPPPVSQALSTRQEVPMNQQTPVINFSTNTPPFNNVPVSDPNSSFSPNIETFTSAGSSYFLLKGDPQSDAAQWANFPAVASVNIDGFDINTVGSISVNKNANFQSTLTTQDLTVSSGAIKLTPSHILETINGDLFFDTELLAKANDIQQIADWSLYPALSTINMSGNILSNAQQIQTVQLTNASGTFGSAGQYLASDGTKIDWITPPSPGNVSQWATFPAAADVNMGLSSITSTNTITFLIPGSSTTLAAGAGGTLLVNGNPLTPGSVSDWANFPAISTINANTNNITNVQKIQTAQLTNATGAFGTSGQYLTSDGTTINWTTAPSPGNVATWAEYPASSNVSLPNRNLDILSANPGVSYPTASLNANVQIGNTSQAPLRPDFNAYCGSFNVGGLTSPATSINLTSIGNVSIAGGGGVGITGGGGVTVAGLGGVSITGVGNLSLAGGDVQVTGAGVVSVGAGGVAITGGGGVAITGGGAVAVTGLGGVSVLGGGGVAVTGGGGVSVVGGAGVLIDSGGSLKTETISNVTGTGNTLAINNVSTINGAAYPPPGGGGVTSLNTEVGAVTITSPTANLVVGSTGAGNIQLTVPGGALSSFLSLYSIFVAPNGNNTTGTGSANNPYLTIARAITARALISATQEVAIQLFPGTYTENPTLTKNTYLVGVSTGEAKQPVNVNGLITLNDATATAGTIGISNLDVQGAVTATTNVNGTAVFSIFATNIFPVSPFAGNSAVSLTNGTMYITETRITGGTSLANALVINALGALFMRDVVIDGSTSATGLTSNTNTITSLRNCFFTSSYAGSAANPLIKFGGPSGAAVQTVEIFDCKFVYTSSTTDTVGNKCCIQMAGVTGTQNLEIVGCLLLCEGAITGSGGQIQCIQKINAGTCNCKYGNLLAGATANHISPAISKIQFNSVP